MRSNREWLLDILESIERIEKYATRGKEAFLANELIQNWMVSNIMVIGESCRAIPNEFQADHKKNPLGGHYWHAEPAGSSIFWY
jgi:uncharacterized protein with HEPN domain